MAIDNDSSTKQEELYKKLEVLMLPADKVEAELYRQLYSAVTGETP